MKSLSKESKVNAGKLYPVTDTGEILSPTGDDMPQHVDPKRLKPKYFGHSPARNGSRGSTRR